MSINLPPELAWVAKLAVGQDWPDADEDKLRSLGEAWDDAARQLNEISREISPIATGVLQNISGAVADEFSSFTQQLQSNLPDMAQAAGQLGKLGKNTGVQVEYTKYMIIAQLIWLAVEIAELAFWAPEAIPAMVTGVRLIVRMLLKRLLTSIATGVAFMVGMDAVIQGIQFLKGDRTHWDTSSTIQALEGGAIGGAIGGVFSGVGSAFAPKFAGSLIGKGVIGGASSLVTTEVMSEIFGGDTDFGSALSSGIIGAMGGGGGRRRFGGGDDHVEVDDPDIHLPSAGDFHIPKLPGEDEAPPDYSDLVGKGDGLVDKAGLGKGDDATAGSGTGKGQGAEEGAGANGTGADSGGTNGSGTNGKGTRDATAQAPHALPTTIESEDPVTSHAATPHVETASESAQSPHAPTTSEVPSVTRQSGGLPGFGTTLPGSGGHPVEAPGHESPAPVADSTRHTATDQPQAPVGPGHAQPPAEVATAPADRPQTPAEGPQTPADVQQVRTGNSQPPAVTDRPQAPGSVDGTTRSSGGPTTQQQAPVGNRPPTESAGGPRTTTSTGSPAAPRPVTESAPGQEATAPVARPTQVATSTGHSPAAERDAPGPDEVAPRAPRAVHKGLPEGPPPPPGRQAPTAPPVAADAHRPTLPDVPRHDPGTTPHEPQDGGHLSGDQAGDERVRQQLDSIVVPAHDPEPPNPLDRAPSPPDIRPQSPDTAIRQRTADLDRAARAAGMSPQDRDAYKRAIGEATAKGDWERAGQGLTDFRHHVETRTTQQRYDAFRSHTGGGFDRLTNLTGPKADWQAKVDEVEAARRSGDPDLLDSKLNEYSSYVESHVPSEVLTGHDAPLPFHQDVEDVRQRLAMATDGPAADRLRAQLDELRTDAQLRDRLTALRNSTTADPQTQALRQRLDEAATPDESAYALKELEQHQELTELRNRLDHLKSDEPTPYRAPKPGSEADLRRRLDALGDDHERELRERADRAATPDEADRALRDLQDHRAERALQQRLDRLKQDTPHTPSDQELRDRLDALHDDGDDPRAARLRHQAQEAATQDEAEEALGKLGRHLDHREQQRQDELHDLNDRLEQLRQQHTEQLLGGHTDDARETGRQINDVRDQLTGRQTYDERVAGLRHELAQDTAKTESPGHLDRITTGSGRHEQPPAPHTPAPEHTTSTPVARPVGAHTSGTDRTGGGGEQHDTKPAVHAPHEEQRPHQHEQWPHQQNQQFVARRPPREQTTPGTSHEGFGHPSRDSVPSVKDLDDLRASVGSRSGPPPRMRLDRTPRYVVRSGFDQRRFAVGDTPYTDLTVRIALRDDGSGAHDADDTWSRAEQGVKQYFNDPKYTLPNGDRLHVTIERAGPGDKPHLTVDLVGADHGMDQRSWTPGAKPVEYAHEISHQLGLRDEYADETAPQRPHIPGSLLGDVHQRPEHEGLSHGGLRDRHLQLLGALTSGHDDLLAHQGHTGGHTGEQHTGEQHTDRPQGHTGESVPPKAPSPSTATGHTPAEVPVDPQAHAAAVDVATTHLGVLRRPMLRQFANGVVGGAFTGKKGAGGRVTVTGSKLDDLERQVRRFYQVSKQLHDATADHHPLTLYRAVQMDPQTRGADEFIERLPSSTSLSSSHWREWTQIQGGARNYAVFEIKVPPEHEMMVLSYPPGHTHGEGDPPPINADQHEVTLGPSRLRVTGRRTDGDATIISVEAHRLPLDEAIALMRDTRSDMGSAETFKLFTDSFQHESLLQAYDYELEGTRLEQSVSDDGLTHTFTLTRPDVPGNVQITVRHDPATGTVHVERSNSDGKSASTEWNQDNINLIASYLKQGQLHESPSAFESIAVPSQWYDVRPGEGAGEVAPKLPASGGDTQHVAPAQVEDHPRQQYDDPADDPAWQQSRQNAPAVPRQHTWVDPVSDPTRQPEAVSERHDEPPTTHVPPVGTKAGAPTDSTAVKAKDSAETTDTTDTTATEAKPPVDTTPKDRPQTVTTAKVTTESGGTSADTTAKPVTKPTDRPTEKPADEQPTHKAAETQPAHQPAEQQPGHKPVEEPKHDPATDHASAKDHTSTEHRTSDKDTPTPGDEQQRVEPPPRPRNEPAKTLGGRHTASLAGKKITENPPPDDVRERIETLLGAHAHDTSVTQRLDAALDPANFRTQHGPMVNGGWRFTVHVDGRPYEVEVKATAKPWRLDPDTDAAKDNDGDGFDVSSESAHDAEPRKTEMTSSQAGLEFGPTIVRPVNDTLSVLVNPSVKLGGATHGRETSVKSSAQTANQFAFTGRTDSYTSDFTYQVKVTDHQGTQLTAKGATAPITGTVRADVPRPEDLAQGRPGAWQGWDPPRTAPTAPSATATPRPTRAASGHPVSITGLETARDAVYEALPREARPDGTAHQAIEEFFQPSNVINEFEHASGWGLLSKPLTLSDGSRAHLHLTIEPDDSTALHTVDDKSTLGSKTSGEHGHNRTENSSWSVGLSGGATGEVWKANDSSESRWLTGTAGYTGTSSLTHGAKAKNAIGTETGHERTGKADLVATNVRLRVRLIRHRWQAGPDGLHGTTTTRIGDHAPAPSQRHDAAPHTGDVAITIHPQNGEVLRAVPHDDTAPAAGDQRRPLAPDRLTDPVTAPRTTFLDVPGSSELVDHVVREMWTSHPGVLPPPEALHPGATTAHGGDGTANHRQVAPQAWENLRSLHQQLSPSRLRGAAPKLLDGTYRITLDAPHLPLRSGTTHEILIKAEAFRGTHVGSGKSTSKDAATRTTGADKSVNRGTKHVVNFAGNIRSSLDHPDVTRGFGNGNLDITAHNPSHGLTTGTETEVKRQFSLEADTDTFTHPLTYHVMIGVADPEHPTTHLPTPGSVPHAPYTKPVSPDGHLTVEVARTPDTTSATPPPRAIPKLDALPQRHVIRHVSDPGDFRDHAKQSLTSAFEKKAKASPTATASAGVSAAATAAARRTGLRTGGQDDEHPGVPDLKQALESITDEGHLRSMVSASHGGWANSGDEQVGSGRDRDTIGLATRTRLSNLRFRETLPGEGKLEIETKSSVSTTVADKNTRGLKGGLGFDAGRFPVKDDPHNSLQVRGGLKGKGGASRNSGENVKQKMTTSRKAAYKGTWHVYEADADVTVQGRVTDAGGNVTLGEPRTGRHRVLVLLSDDDVRALDPNATAPVPGSRHATLLGSGLLGGATADIRGSDEILGEIDRQIRGLDTADEVPEAALPFADTFSPENLSANYEDLVGRGILDHHVHESRTQRVITEVLVRGVPRGKWTDEGDHSSGDTTRKVGFAQTVKGSAGHNWSLGADGNFRISYAPVDRQKPGQSAAEFKAEESRSGFGNLSWAPSLGGEATRSKSAETGVTTKVEHKTSKFGDTVKFTNHMRFEVTVTQRTEYGRFVNLAKPRPVDPAWPVHVYVPKSLTETAEQAAAHQQPHVRQQQPRPPQVMDGGDTIGMQPLGGSAQDRTRWQQSLDSAHDLVGFDRTDALVDHAQTVLTTPRPWGDGVLGRAGSAISWGLGSAASALGHWAGAMTPEAAHRLVSSFVTDPRLDGTANPLVREQRLPLEQQVSLRQSLSTQTLPTVFHLLKDPARGYRTVPIDGTTGLEVHMRPTGEAQEVSTREDGSDEITVSTEHESGTSASNALNGNVTPLAVPVVTKNPAVTVPLPTGAAKIDRDQTFESASPVTRAPGVPNRTLAPPALPHGTTSTEPGKAKLKGPQVLMRQPVRLSTRKYDESGTYGNTLHTDGHVYYWVAKQADDATTAPAAAPVTTDQTDHTTATTDFTKPDTTSSAKDTTVPPPPVEPVHDVTATHDASATTAHSAPNPPDHPTVSDLDTTTRSRPGAPLTSPGDGRCLLYSVVASTPPEHWPEALRGGPAGDAHAQHAAVLRQMRQLADSHAPVGADTPLGRAAEALRQMVLRHVRRTPPDHLPFDVTELYRRHQEPALRQHLSQQTPHALREQLRRQGVHTVLSPDWMDPRTLRGLYVQARTEEFTARGMPPQEAARRAGAEVPETTDRDGKWVLADEALSTGDQLDYVDEHMGGLDLGFVGHDGLVGALVEMRLHEPLSAAEHRTLVDALGNWVPGDGAWNTVEGEMFPALVAHTLGTRLITHDQYAVGATLRTVGPQDTGRTVHVYFAGGNHYNASALPPSHAHTPTSVSTAPPKADGAPPHGGSTSEVAPRAPRAPTVPTVPQAPAAPVREHDDAGDEDLWQHILDSYADGPPDEQTWMDRLYGDTLAPDAYERARQALWALHTLDLPHTESPDAHGTPRLEALARRVLRLEDEPDDDAYRRLLALAEHAGPSRLTDASVLAAHALAADHQALDDSTAVVDGDGYFAGRNWSDPGAGAPETATFTVTGPDGAQTEHQASWHDPYVVTAQGTPDRLLVTTPSGTFPVTDPAEFAELVALDPMRGDGQEILLAVSRGQTGGLAQLVADRARVPVWSTDSEVRPLLSWRTGREHLDLTGGSGAWALHLGGEGDPLDLFDGIGHGSETPDQVAGGVGHPAAASPRSGGAADHSEKLNPPPREEQPPRDPADPLDHLRARPFTTSDYQVIATTPDTVLFEEPTGMYHSEWNYNQPGSDDVPRLTILAQGHRQTLVGDHPPLHVSGDLSLAHRQHGYGQQVFATRSAVETANRQLALAGSNVRLHAEDLTLRVADGKGAGRELVRVTPQFLTRSKRSEEEVCRDFAQMVSGGVPASHVVFRRADGSGAVTGPINALGRTEVTGIHHLAEALGDVADGRTGTGALDPSWASHQVLRDDRLIAESDGPTPGKSYGSALSYDPVDNPRRELLADAARRIGVNEHAWARVGETYLVHSINARDEEGLPSLAVNYAKPGARPGRHFGYHFAAVVLSSEDGAHQMTLENFARRAQITAMVRAAVTHNVETITSDGFRKLRTAVERQLQARKAQGTDEAAIGRLSRHLDLVDALAKARQAMRTADSLPEGSPDHRTAAAAYEHALKIASARMKQAADLPKGSELWHFRMFSRRPGETMHEVSADLLTSRPSAEANPLTAVIVHGHRLPQISVGFDEGSRQLSKVEARKLTYVAEHVVRAGLWNHHNGLPLPRITVTGRGNSRRPTLGGALPNGAQARADTVREELRDRLDRFLINYQHGSPQPHLTAADFPLTVTTERASANSDAAAGRQTTVTVHDPRKDDVPTAVPPRHGQTAGAADISPRAPRDSQVASTQVAEPPAQRPHEPYDSERLTIGDVDFPDESAELTSRQLETVHRLAAEVAWASLANVRAGFPPPRVEVVGHAVGMRNGLPHFGEALRRGQQRADGVADTFRSALAVHLARLQTDGQTVVVPEDVVVTTRSEGNAAPGGGANGADASASRSRALIVVDLPRPRTAAS
ncbi:hypothetical protein [Streptomyces sp. ICBB 8177]|uniref:WXG100-like domain-containing protein n=1 Tax=Streptomyces sp. ICBB 8177 TaxID=563922 RepID=UPI000D67E1BB|nr:hypothetical protein [Streptomyces sp. ICBB 8177]PWI42165.1 hypothetical protein CK485_25755 [Streptomyces sp. ICBB 8177]